MLQRNCSRRDEDRISVGSAAIGALGYVRAAEELLAQSRRLDVGIRHIMLARLHGDY